MPQGRLEVLLIGAKGLDNSDFLGTEEQHRVRARDTPEWNETFVFTIFNGVTELGLKIMDKDTFSSDDSLSEAAIDLDPLYEERSLSAATYNVVKGGEYCCQIRVSLAFTPEERYGRSLQPEESYGGWKQSWFE